MALPTDIPVGYLQPNTYQLYNNLYKAVIAIGNPMALPADIPLELGQCGTYDLFNWIYKALYALSLSPSPSLPTGNSSGEMVFWDNTSLGYAITNTPTLGQIPRFNGTDIVMDNVLFNITGEPIIDYFSGIINSQDGKNSIDTDGRLIIDDNEIISINYQNRFLSDSLSNEVLDYQNNLLNSSDGKISVDWENRILSNDDNDIVLNFQNQTAYDTDFVESIQWNVRHLIDDAGIISNDYQNRILNRSDGTPFINYSTNYGVSSPGTTTADIVPTGAVNQIINGVTYKVLHA